MYLDCYSAGFEGLEKATGINVASIVILTLMERVHAAASGKRAREEDCGADGSQLSGATKVARAN